MLTKLSFDFSHPAHYLAFRNVLLNKDKLGFEPFIFIQEKERLKDLLVEDNLNFLIRRNKKTTLSRISLLPRDILYIRKVMKERDIASNFGKVSIVGSWAAKTLNRRSIVIDDTDTPMGQINICRWPATEIWTPNCYFRCLGKKHKKFNGIFHLAYLDPSVFQPTKSIPQSLGLLERGKPILIRIVSYEATHDWKNRNNRDDFEYIINKLDKDYEIVLSIEGKNYPKKFDKFVKKFKAADYHHILAYSKLYIGSGASSAAEAAVLGVPSIYTNYQKPGFIQWLEKKYGIINSIETTLLNFDDVKNILKKKESKWIDIRKKILDDCINVPNLIKNLVKREIEIHNNQ